MRARVTSSRSLCWVIALAIYCATATAAEPPAAPPEPSKEMRAKMASAHEQMATCLRSEKSMAQCHKEIMKSHHELMGEHGCPMMEMGMHPSSMKDANSSTPKDP